MFKTAIKGAAWTTVSTVVRSIVSLLQVSILTKFLAKSDFGIVAIASLFIGFTSIFLDLGISIGILHKQEISRQEYSSLFWLNILTGFSLSLILIIAAPIVSYAYNDSELTPIIQLLCLNLFFSSLGNQHRTVQLKKLRFKLISIVEIVSSILTISVAVYTAYSGWGVYSLVCSTMFASFFSGIVFLAIGLSKDKNIFFHFSWVETYPFLKIGSFNIAGQILDYLSQEIDIIIISATLGKETLGVYSLCKKMVGALFSAVMPIYNKVLVPLMTNLQDNIVHAREVTYDILETVAITNYPVFLLLAIFPGFVIHTLYGDNYLEGIYVMSILAIHYGYMSPGSPASALQIVFARTDLGFYWTICRIAIYASMAYIGAQFSIEGMVLAIFIGSLLSAPLAWTVTVRPIVGGRFWDYFSKSFNPLIVSLLIATPFWYWFHLSISIPVIIIAGISFLLLDGIAAFYFFKDSYIIKKTESKLR